MPDGRAGKIRGGRCAIDQITPGLKKTADRSVLRMRRLVDKEGRRVLIQKALGVGGLNMATFAQSLVAALLLSAASGLGACSKPAPAAVASDPAPSADPVAASAAPASDTPASSSTQTVADNRDSGGSSGECHQVTIGGTYQPGFNGAPGIMTPGQTMTVCSAPTPAPPLAAPVAAAAVAPAPAPAAPARADPAPSGNP